MLKWLSFSTDQPRINFAWSATAFQPRHCPNQVQYREEFVNPMYTNGLLHSITERTEIVRQADHTIVDLDSGVTLNENAVASMNCWGLHPDIFTYLETDFVIFCKTQN